LIVAKQDGTSVLRYTIVCSDTAFASELDEGYEWTRQNIYEQSLKIINKSASAAPPAGCG